MAWSQDFQLLNTHSYRHICRQSLYLKTFQKHLKALSSLCNVSCIKRWLRGLNRNHFTSQALASRSYLGLHCHGNFMLSNDFEEKLDETSFYPHKLTHAIKKIQSDPNLHAANYMGLQRPPSSSDQLICPDFGPWHQPRHHLTVTGVLWIFSAFQRRSTVPSCGITQNPKALLIREWERQTQLWALLGLHLK